MIERERERERKQPPCPLAQRVCLRASVADGAYECAITTLMNDISLTLHMEKPRRREGGVKKTPVYSPDARP